ncbi:YbaN family protein [Paraglaciecola sp.]|uniref:YbaN family protein n=1 Tax=Paraglaciecola sp. TaxID=1920173 RepID=UPI003EF2E428
MKKPVYLFCGGCCVLLGVIGVMLPLLPTTPFLILASACFAKSSKRFHQKLLNNPWFGKDIQRWEQSKTMSRLTKKRATSAILITFAISIGLLHSRILLQFMLIAIACILLLWIWRINEKVGSK